MALVMNLYYKGENGSALKFVKEMEESGTADLIRKEEGNLEYRYFLPIDDSETVLLIDKWRDQASLDKHHESPMMQTIIELREKYDLHMEAERLTTVEVEEDNKFLRK